MKTHAEHNYMRLLIIHLFFLKLEIHIDNKIINSNPSWFLIHLFFKPFV